jgi:hypothetical protein
MLISKVINEIIIAKRAIFFFEELILTMKLFNGNEVRPC